MNTLVLLLILVAQLITIVLICLSRAPVDYSQEDRKVKETTEEINEARKRVDEAKNRLPHQD